jgi:hypothetical protein
MHPLHKLGNANAVANYHEYNQTLIKMGIANGAASNAYLTASYVRQNQVHHYEVQNRNPVQPKAYGKV